MNTLSNPNAVHKPAGPYHHTVSVPENARWLAISGQVGMDREGKIATGVRAQSEQVFRNIAACLEANGMRKEDLVKVTVYLTDARSWPTTARPDRQSWVTTFSLPRRS
jgi:enamine deaminase RidA (YjgF/YER057c/UK114 family)